MKIKTITMMHARDRK